MDDAETKQCPYCAEIIKKEAKICRYCQRDLAGGQLTPKYTKDGSQGHEVVNAKSGVADGVKLGCGMFIVLPILIILGLLALVFGMGFLGAIFRM